MGGLLSGSRTHLLLYLSVWWESFPVKDETPGLVFKSGLDDEHGLLCDGGECSRKI